MISRIMKVEVHVVVISQSLRLITYTKPLIILEITETESNNCFIIHCMLSENQKRDNEFNV